MSNLRKEIMEKCPEEFEEQLLDFIDMIEVNISDILNFFEIDSIDDLHQLRDAYNQLNDLKNELY
jgi:molybdopterin-guanine dinucleotide biosynthesis protein A